MRKVRQTHATATADHQKAVIRTSSAIHLPAGAAGAALEIWRKKKRRREELGGNTSCPRETREMLVSLILAARLPLPLLARYKLPPA